MAPRAGPPRPSRRTAAAVEIDRLAAETVRALGRRARDARRRRRWTQAQLGNRLGLSQSEVSRLELGDGDGAPIRVWLALAAALDLRSTFEYTRDWREEPDDAGHLAIQELLLRLARAIGVLGSFELRVGRTDPAHSIDVCLRDDSRRRLIVEEAWNTIVDIGAAARSFHRKLEAAADVAVAIGGERRYAVHGVWVVRATRRNRALVARYPGVFERHLPGSSRRWVDALTAGAEPPAEPGLVWCDPAATRLFAWRRYSTTTPVRSSVGSG
jgi:transcriptional regulator with XRE-family HTH domain